MLSGTRTWLRSTVAISPYSGMDGFGQSTFSAAVDHKCLIVQKNVKTFAADGAEVVSSTQIYLDGSASISVNDKIVLPDSSSPRILNVGISNDIRDGSAYMKVIYT